MIDEMRTSIFRVALSAVFLVILLAAGYFVGESLGAERAQQGWGLYGIVAGLVCWLVARPRSRMPIPQDPRSSAEHRALGSQQS